MRLGRSSYFFLIILLYPSFSMESNTKKRVKVIPQGKIVGGVAVNLTSFPSAGLFFNMGGQCACTILNEWTVLTAGHCFDINKDMDNMLVEVGARYLYDFQSEEHEVIRFVVHKDYNKTALFSCDIALVFLKVPISFSSKAKRAILANSYRWMESGKKHFQAIGWGMTSYGGPLSKDGLMMTELEFVSSKECSRMHGIRLSPDMFCLYGNGTTDTCKGDSGGGIWWENMIVGITSHGDGCAKKNKPSVYANVWYFKKWIKDEVADFFQDYCVNAQQ